MKQQKTKKGLFADKRVALAVALVLAVLCWVIVAGFINPGNSRKITNVTIDYARSEDLYKSQSLQLVGEVPYLFAEVRVTGDGSVTGPLGSDSVTVFPDYSTVNGPGQQEVKLSYAKVEPGDYNISEVSVRGGGYSLDNNPQGTITLTFERQSSKTLPVSVSAEGITAATGYFRDTVVVDPTQVTLFGPQTEVDRVAQVVAIVAEEEALEERKIYEAPLTLLDANGDVIDKSALSLTYSAETAQVDISILEIRTVSLMAEFINLPSNIDTEWFYDRVQLSVDSLQVVGSATAFEHLDEPVTVATFDAAVLELGWESQPVSIELPEGSELSNHDQMRQVVVSFDTSEMAERIFEVEPENITVRNSPRGADIEPLAETVSVKVIGMNEQLEALLPDNILVEIDAAGVSGSRGGQQTLPARVSVPGSNRVIPVGSYTVVCDLVTG